MNIQELTQIEKSVFVKAPRSRVWKALTDSKEFAKWFHVKTNDSFQPGSRVNLVSTYPGHEGEAFFFDVDEVTPETRFAWRWNPGGKEAGLPVPDDPMTRVVFDLEEVDGGTLVKVTESGFDRISLVRRAAAFEGNSQGWTIQMQNIRNYVEAA